MRKVRIATAFADDEPYEEPYEAEHNEVSPTGWIYDRDTRKWEPPESLKEESRRKWKWDPEKKIWIDLEKEARLERYRKFRESQGMPPSYEDWKKQKLKEMKEQEKAASPNTQTE